MYNSTNVVRTSVPGGEELRWFCVCVTVINAVVESRVVTPTHTTTLLAGVTSWVFFFALRTYEWLFGLFLPQKSGLHADGVY